MFKDKLRISTLFCFSSFFVCSEKTYSSETCMSSNPDEFLYYCEALDMCLDEMGSTPCNGTCGTWDWYIYCEEFGQCFDPWEMWLCDGVCIEPPPETGTHKPCSDGTCAHEWFHFCEAENLCVNRGIPCDGVCWENDTFLCDAPTEYCNLLSDINDLKYDCYDRTDETFSTDWEISLNQIDAFLLLEEAIDLDFK